MVMRTHGPHPRLRQTEPLDNLREHYFTMPTPRAAGLSRRDTPAYQITEAAGYVRVAPATLRSWVVGREYPTQQGRRHFPLLISLADPRRRLLSFNNLVEAHVLRALRTEHGFAIREVRTALGYAEKELGIDRLLLSRQLWTDKVDLFLNHFGELISLSRSGQMAMRAVLENHLSRIEWDRADLPRRLYPFLQAEVTDISRRIAIDPDIAFGRPVLWGRGISTHAIAARVDAGEEPGEIADDYGISEAEITEAVVFERAA